MRLKKPTPDQVGLAKLPKSVRNKMGYMKKGGTPKPMDYRKTGMFYGCMLKKDKK